MKLSRHFLAALALFAAATLSPAQSPRSVGQSAARLLSGEATAKTPYTFVGFACNPFALAGPQEQPADPESEVEAPATPATAAWQDDIVEQGLKTWQTLCQKGRLPEAEALANVLSSLQPDNPRVRAAHTVTQFFKTVAVEMAPRACPLGMPAADMEAIFAPAGCEALPMPRAGDEAPACVRTASQPGSCGICASIAVKRTVKARPGTSCCPDGACCPDGPCCVAGMKRVGTGCCTACTKACTKAGCCAEAGCCESACGESVRCATGCAKGCMTAAKCKCGKECGCCCCKDGPTGSAGLSVMHPACCEAMFGHPPIMFMMSCRPMPPALHTHMVMPVPDMMPPHPMMIPPPWLHEGMPPCPEEMQEMRRHPRRTTVTRKKGEAVQPVSHSAQHAHLVTPLIDAHCERLTCAGSPDRLVLEGDVRLQCKKDGQNIRIEAQRVVVNVKDGTFVVESRHTAFATPTSDVCPSVHVLPVPPTPGR